MLTQACAQENKASHDRTLTGRSCRTSSGPTVLKRLDPVPLFAGTVSWSRRRTAAWRTSTVHAQASQVELLTVERIKPWFAGAMIARVVDRVVVDLTDAATLASGKHIKTAEQRQSQKDSHGRPFQFQPPDRAASESDSNGTASFGTSCSRMKIEFRWNSSAASLRGTQRADSDSRRLMAFQEHSIQAFSNVPEVSADSAAGSVAYLRAAARIASSRASARS